MLQTFDQTHDPAGTLRTTCHLFTQRYGIPVGDDWSVDDNGTCRCPKGWQCRSPGKHPARAKPREHATRDMTEVRRLVALGRNFAAYPDPRHLVLDVEAGGLPFLLTFCLLYGIDPAELRDTLTTCTGGGGLHLWFWLPAAWREHPPRGLVNWLPWVDVKTSVKASDKATLPGSRHPSGRFYTLQTDDAGNFPDPRCAPERLLAAIAAGYRWVAPPANEWEPLRANPDGTVTFADGVRWLDPRSHARILAPGEVGPPPPSSAPRYSGSEVDTSGWGLPADDTWDGTPS